VWASQSFLDPTPVRSAAYVGTIVAEFGPEIVIIHEVGDHQESLRQLEESSAKPLCMAQQASAKAAWTLRMSTMLAISQIPM
jgi:hypothetical protein